jgi:hypothetical protein
MVPGFEVLIFWVKCCLYVSGHDTRTVIAGIQETSPDGNIHFGSNAAYMFPDMILEPLLRASKRPRLMGTFILGQMLPICFRT